jgi:hypothetical protein
MAEMALTAIEVRVGEICRILKIPELPKTAYEALKRALLDYEAQAYDDAIGIIEERYSDPESDIYRLAPHFRQELLSSPEEGLRKAHDSVVRALAEAVRARKEAVIRG